MDFYAMVEQVLILLRSRGRFRRWRLDILRWRWRGVWRSWKYLVNSIDRLTRARLVGVERKRFCEGVARRL